MSRPEKRKVEFIESYWTGGEFGSDYQWNDNHGELVRCRDCEHGEECVKPYKDYWCHLHDAYQYGDWFCADGEKRTD